VSASVEIRRWVGLKRPDRIGWTVEITLGPELNTICFNHYDKWWVRVPDLELALSELESYEKRSHRREGIEVKVETHHAGDDATILFGRIPYHLTLEPGEEKGAVRLRAYTMSFAGLNLELPRKELLQIIADRAVLA
jgi:hypothetical protein